MDQIFAALNPVEIVREIESNGIFAVKNAISADFVDRILKDVGPLRTAINANDIVPVQSQNQAYLTHCLTKSKDLFSLITSPFVLDICEEHFPEDFCLHAKRVYSTSYGHHMQWHTDNKKGGIKTVTPGLIFIVYFCDVTDGEFQYIRGSHLWTDTYKFSDYTDELIRQKYGKDVLSFALPKGSLIVYDTRGLHRAKPIVTKDWTRQSLFFSVVSGEGDGEKLLVNTEFLDSVDNRLMRYLRFGRPATYKTFPEGGTSSLLFSDCLRLQGQLLKQLVVSSRRQLTGMLPARHVRAISSLLNKNRLRVQQQVNKA